MSGAAVAYHDADFAHGELVPLGEAYYNDPTKFNQTTFEPVLNEKAYYGQYDHEDPPPPVGPHRPMPTRRLPDTAGTTTRWSPATRRRRRTPPSGRPR